MKKNNTKVPSPKMVFWKRGACSTAMCHLLNREFNNDKPAQEEALNVLAGGIFRKGHQCGMLWGAALATGIQAYSKYENEDTAIEAAVNASKKLVNSFQERTQAVNCRDISKTDWENKLQMMTYMFKVIAMGFVFSPCFNLMAKWTPEALKVTHEGLQKNTKSDKPIQSCASEVLKKMGASNEDVVSAAGFAGGIGLSGYACGALSAVIWYKMLIWCKENPGKTPPYFNNPDVTKILNTFFAQTDSEMLCSKICCRQFDSVQDHSDYLKNGGCNELITALSSV